jgi:hypothetical protein
MSVDRADLLLEAWSAERDAVGELERKVVYLETILNRLLHAIATTSFQPTPELSAVIAELVEYSREA